jgi:hypothetical protein
MSQGWCAKGIEKNKANRVKRHGNTFKGVIARSSATFHEKAISFENYKRVMHGFREGNFVNNGGVRWVGRDGTGIPSEGYDCVKYNVAVVTPTDEMRVVRKRGSKVTPKVSFVVAAPTVRQWSRKNGFAGK